MRTHKPLQTYTSPQLPSTCIWPSATTTTTTGKAHCDLPCSFFLSPPPSLPPWAALQERKQLVFTQTRWNTFPPPPTSQSFIISTYGAWKEARKETLAKKQPKQAFLWGGGGKHQKMLPMNSTKELQTLELHERQGRHDRFTNWLNMQQGYWTKYFLSQQDVGIFYLMAASVLA